MPDYAQQWRRRLEPKRPGPMDVRSRLRHFALINYALPKSRLEPHIPADRFEIPEFSIDGRPLALLSAVPFLDIDFHFAHLFPFLKFRFGQTNHRVYVIDRKTGEHCVWFFGTTLGSWVVQLPRLFWRIPWHQARYRIACRYDAAARRYERYRFQVDSAWCDAAIEIEDTGSPVSLARGFSSPDEMAFILTHPLDGYFHRLDGRLGTYSVWHEKIPMTVGRPKNLYFGLYERLGLLSREEMQSPHSIFLCPETEFLVSLPPKLA